MALRTVETVAEMQQLALAARRDSKTIAFVPTMGFLHAGHASLLQAARQQADLLVLSVFVNPTQFAAGEDLERYPRDLQRDMAIAAEAGVDLLFLPTPAQLYPPGFNTWVNVEGLTEPLCGASRPGHFRGVTTVVAKLFAIVQPDLAFFGKKDFQQLAVIRRMTADLNLPVTIVGCPTVREADGLAMSSRNSYLSPAERQSALCLSRAIAATRQAFRAGERRTARLREMALAVIAAEPAARVDYLELRDSNSLELEETATEQTLLAMAVKIGTTRLIDNGVLGEEN